MTNFRTFSFSHKETPCTLAAMSYFPSTPLAVGKCQSIFCPYKFAYLGYAI